MPQKGTPFIPFHIEHIIARQHVDHVSDEPHHLAYACDRCNAFKGPNLSSVDPVSEKIVLLFNPRQDVWHEHFLFCEGEIVGLTPTGRATVRLLNMNASRRVELRNVLDGSGDE